ncbi:MAG: hypothetical protein L0Z46_10305 [Nitrospiraceae bacterium]|nr:hypothetical protein [Nitrospiraceae bacterium]
MALLAEELVEEWLNRQGYFTIRGVKLRVHEMDLLAIRPGPGGIECRQIEVQASVRPVSYVTRVPKSFQEQTGRAATSMKIRSDEELRQGIREWIAKKYDHPEKKRLRQRLAPGPWSRELVVHVVKHNREIELMRKEGIKVLLLGDIVAELKRGRLLLDGAAGVHLLDLVAMTTDVGTSKQT